MSVCICDLPVTEMFIEMKNKSPLRRFNDFTDCPDFCVNVHCSCGKNFKFSLKRVMGMPDLFFLIESQYGDAYMITRRPTRFTC